MSEYVGQEILESDADIQVTRNMLTVERYTPLPSITKTRTRAAESLTSSLLYLDSWVAGCNGRQPIFSSAVSPPPDLGFEVSVGRLVQRRCDRRDLA